MRLFEKLNEPAYRHTEISKHQHPLDDIISARGSFELIRNAEEIGEIEFKTKYRIPDFNDGEFEWKWSYASRSDDKPNVKLRDFFNSYDVLPSFGFGLCISLPLLKNLIPDFIPESIIEYEYVWRHESPSMNMGMVYFSPESYFNDEFDRWEEINSLAHTVLKPTSENKIELLFDDGRLAKEWRNNAKKYTQLLLEYEKYCLEKKESEKDEEKIKDTLFHVSNAEFYTLRDLLKTGTDIVNSETYRLIRDIALEGERMKQVYVDSIPFMKDLCDFYLEKIPE